MATSPADTTVLIVEDDDTERDALAALLKGHGYRVVAVGDGLRALGALDAEPRPDLVLLDMFLPLLDGWEFLERLRRASHRPPPVVVVMTGSILTQEWAESHGCAGFL